MALEINSLKFAQNRALSESRTRTLLAPRAQPADREIISSHVVTGTFADCVTAILPALFDATPLGGKSAKARKLELQACLKRWGPLITRFVQSRGDQVALLNALQAACMASEALGAASSLLLMKLYDADILAEEVILPWAEEAEPEFLELASEFLEWLQEAEEEEDDDDDE